jgi:hypothetical protein
MRNDAARLARLRLSHGQRNAAEANHPPRQHPADRQDAIRKQRRRLCRSRRRNATSSRDSENQHLRILESAIHSTEAARDQSFLSTKQPGEEVAHFTVTRAADQPFPVDMDRLDSGPLALANNIRASRVSATIRPRLALSPDSLETIMMIARRRVHLPSEDIVHRHRSK